LFFSEHEVDPFFGQLFGQAFGAGSDIPSVDPSGSAFVRCGQQPVAALLIGLLGGKAPGGGQA
jgi:hypothetical protein